MATDYDGKVMMAWVHNGVYQAEFADSVLDFFFWQGQAERRVVDGVGRARGLYVPVNRNAILNQFLDRGNDFLWFIDTDIQFKPEDLLALMEHAQLDNIVAGGYRIDFGGILVPVWMEPFGDRYEFLKEWPKEVTKLGATGMGFTVIGREVIEKIGNAAFTQESCSGEPDDVWGEDVIFCRRATEAGFEILGVPEARVRHKKLVLLD